MEKADILSDLLSDPEKLSAAVGAVSSMMGKPRGDAEEKPKPPAKQSDAVVLIQALKPFLSAERKAKADRAIKLLTLAELASGIQDIW